MNAIWYVRVKYPGTKPHSAIPVELVHQPDDKHVVTLPVPGFRQARNYSCGYTAVLMVLRHFGWQTQGAELFAALGTTRDGTGQSAIIRVLREQGLRAGLRYDMDFASTQRCIDAGKVLIGYLNDEHHWLVLYGYGERPRRIFVADPEPGKACVYPWESYGQRLSGFSIVCSPRAAPAPQRSATRAAPAGREDGGREQLAFDFPSGP